jgi:hypothetical protein
LAQRDCFLTSAIRSFAFRFPPKADLTLGLANQTQETPENRPRVKEILLSMRRTSGISTSTLP